MSVGKKAPQESAIKVKNQSSSPSLSHHWDFQHLLQGVGGEGPLRLADLKEFSGFQIALLNKVSRGKKRPVCDRRRSTEVSAGREASGLPKRLRHPEEEPPGSPDPDALQLAAEVPETDPRPRRR